mmetsp:Transcript_5291/g.19355  ORF Transcript_5291/g.19355 Transcript_5291/m.19355 type:complete len:1032 (+) Transcript_5291:687-3782(+)
MATEVVQAVVNALNVLNSNEAPIERRRQAQSYLLQFERSDQAWEVCKHMLAARTEELPLGTSVYAAQTLRNKIREVPGGFSGAHCEDLHKIVLLHLHVFSRGPSVVRAQLCLALAAFTANGGIGSFDSLREDVGDQSLLLSVLSCIPDEVQRRAASSDASSFHMDRSWGPQVLDMCSSLINQTNNNLTLLSLECVATWLRCIQLTSTEMVLARPCLVEQTMALFTDSRFEDEEMICQAAAEVLYELADYHASVLGYLVPSLLAFGHHVYTKFLGLRVLACPTSIGPVTLLPLEEDRGSPSTSLENSFYALCECANALVDQAIQGTPDGNRLGEMMMGFLDHTCISREQMVATFPFWTAMARGSQIDARRNRDRWTLIQTLFLRVLSTFFYKLGTGDGSLVGTRPISQNLQQDEVEDVTQYRQQGANEALQEFAECVGLPTALGTIQATLGSSSCLEIAEGCFSALHVLFPCIKEDRASLAECRHVLSNIIASVSQLPPAPNIAVSRGCPLANVYRAAMLTVTDIVLEAEISSFPTGVSTKLWPLIRSAIVCSDPLVSRAGSAAAFEFWKTKISLEVAVEDVESYVRLAYSLAQTSHSDQTSQTNIVLSAIEAVRRRGDEDAVKSSVATLVQTDQRIVQETMAMAGRHLPFGAGEVRLRDQGVLALARVQALCCIQQHVSTDVPVGQVAFQFACPLFSSILELVPGHLQEFVHLPRDPGVIPAWFKCLYDLLESCCSCVIHALKAKIPDAHKVVCSRGFLESLGSAMTRIQPMCSPLLRLLSEIICPALEAGQGVAWELLRLVSHMPTLPQVCEQRGRPFVRDSLHALLSVMISVFHSPFIWIPLEGSAGIVQAALTEGSQALRSSSVHACSRGLALFSLVMHASIECYERIWSKISDEQHYAQGCELVLNVVIDAGGSIVQGLLQSLLLQGPGQGSRIQKVCNIWIRFYEVTRFTASFQANGSAPMAEWISAACRQLRLVYGRRSSMDEAIEVELCQLFDPSTGDAYRARGAARLRLLAKRFSSCFDAIRL